MTVRFCQEAQEIKTKWATLIATRDKPETVGMRRITINYERYSWYLWLRLYCGYSTTASASAFHAEDDGSIPFTRSKLS